MLVQEARLGRPVEVVVGDVVRQPLEQLGLRGDLLADRMFEGRAEFALVVGLGVGEALALRPVPQPVLAVVVRAVPSPRAVEAQPPAEERPVIGPAADDVGAREVAARVGVEDHRARAVCTPPGPFSEHRRLVQAAAGVDRHLDRARVVLGRAVERAARRHVAVAINGVGYRQGLPVVGVLLEDDVGDHRPTVHVDAGRPARDDVHALDLLGRDATQHALQRVGLAGGRLAVDQHIAA